MVVGDRVNLPDGIYTTEQDSFAAVVLSRKFVAELEIYDEYGESKS